MKYEPDCFARTNPEATVALTVVLAGVILCGLPIAIAAAIKDPPSILTVIAFPILLVVAARLSPRT